MPVPRRVPLIRDAVPSDRTAIVEFNRRFAVETENKVLWFSARSAGNPEALPATAMSIAESSRNAASMSTRSIRTFVPSGSGGAIP